MVARPARSFDVLAESAVPPQSLSARIRRCGSLRQQSVDTAKAPSSTSRLGSSSWDLPQQPPGHHQKGESTAASPVQHPKRPHTPPGRMTIWGHRVGVPLGRFGSPSTPGGGRDRW